MVIFLKFTVLRDNCVQSRDDGSYSLLLVHDFIGYGLQLPFRSGRFVQQLPRRSKVSEKSGVDGASRGRCLNPLQSSVGNGAATQR